MRQINKYPTWYFFHWRCKICRTIPGGLQKSRVAFWVEPTTRLKIEKREKVTCHSCLKQRFSQQAYIKTGKTHQYILRYIHPRFLSFIYGGFLVFKANTSEFFKRWFFCFIYFFDFHKFKTATEWNKSVPRWKTGNLTKKRNFFLEYFFKNKLKWSQK